MMEIQTGGKECWKLSGGSKHGQERHFSSCNCQMRKTASRKAKPDRTTTSCTIVHSVTVEIPVCLFKLNETCSATLPGLRSFLNNELICVAPSQIDPKVKEVDAVCAIDKRAAEMPLLSTRTRGSLSTTFVGKYRMLSPGSFTRFKYGGICDIQRFVRSRRDGKRRREERDGNGEGRV